MLTLRAQLIILGLSLGSMASILWLVRHRRVKVKYLMLWLAVTSATTVLAMFPRQFDELAEVVGISYPPALLFLLAIVFLLFVVVQFSWELSRFEDRTRRLAEELALLRLEVEHRQDSDTAAS